jgi:hypothetical protein
MEVEGDMIAAPAVILCFESASRNRRAGAYGIV